MQDTVFRAEALTKRYRTCTALDRVDMEIRRGQIYGFVGQNGAGKTILFRILAGLARPTGGEIGLFGAKGERALARERRRIGCIIETAAVYPDMTALQNLETQRIQRGIPGKACLADALALSGLEDTGRRKARDFSLGMRQRLAIAIALLGEPELLVLDEPVNGLDPTGIIEVRELLRRVNREWETTILISSHLLSEMHLLATHYGFIHKGRMLEQIPAADLNEKCRKYVRIEVGDAGLAAVIIERELKTANYSVHPGSVIRLEGYAENPDAVLNALSRGGVCVKSVSVHGDSLEAYFTKLIGGAAHA
jgi:ABC-2 type transport system ATP-binding protein